MLKMSLGTEILLELLWVSALTSAPSVFTSMACPRLNGRNTHGPEEPYLRFDLQLMGWLCCLAFSLVSLCQIPHLRRSASQLFQLWQAATSRSHLDRKTISSP